jgi:hypothetical protein
VLTTGSSLTATSELPFAEAVARASAGAGRVSSGASPRARSIRE